MAEELIGPGFRQGVVAGFHVVEIVDDLALSKLFHVVVGDVEQLLKFVFFVQGDKGSHFYPFKAKYLS